MVRKPIGLSSWLNGKPIAYAPVRIAIFQERTNRGNFEEAGWAAFRCDRVLIPSLWKESQGTRERNMAPLRRQRNQPSSVRFSIPRRFRIFSLRERVCTFCKDVCRQTSSPMPRSARHLWNIRPPSRPRQSIAKQPNARRCSQSARTQPAISQIFARQTE